MTAIPLDERSTVRFETGCDVLDAAERDRLAKLEAVVERGLEVFIDVGLALAEIRDGRLYRETHATFATYLSERWGVSRSYGYRLINGARVAELVTPIGDIANEGQARELVPLLDRPDELLEVVRELREKHGEDLTAAKLRAAVGEHLGRRRDETARKPGTRKLGKIQLGPGPTFGLDWQTVEYWRAMAGRDASSGERTDPERVDDVEPVQSAAEKTRDYFVASLRWLEEEIAARPIDDRSRFLVGTYVRRELRRVLSESEANDSGSDEEVQ